MSNRALTLALVFLTTLTSNSYAQDKQIDNQAVINMIGYGLPASAIRDLIAQRAAAAKFEFTDKDIDALQKAKVPSDVLAAMVQASLQQAPSAAAATASVGGHTPPESLIPVASAVTPASQAGEPSAPVESAPAPAVQAQPAAMTAADFTKAVQDLKKSLDAEDPDFGLVIGIGSLVMGPGVTDYTNESNVIRVSNLGRAIPQLLTGASFRTHIPNFKPFQQKGDNKCTQPGETITDLPVCEIWRNRPWSGFVSLKFAPGASQPINGYVFGGTYAIARYLNAFIGYSLTPVNEASPGFRTTASQFVTSEQKAGRLMNFDPNAMLTNAQNAFDGFQVTDSTGKLIYQGNPLAVHYHGGAVFGISIPVYFKSIFR